MYKLNFSYINWRTRLSQRENKQCVWMGAERICQQIQRLLRPFLPLRTTVQRTLVGYLGRYRSCKDFTLKRHGKGTRTNSIFGVRKLTPVQLT